MCAIIGFSGLTTRKVFRQLLKAAQDSGPRSVGIVYAVDDEIHPWKRAVSASYAIRNHNHRVDAAADSFLAYGHTRWPTHGDVIDENAHPFEHDGIFFAHNGVVPNYQSIKPDATVDSECLGVLIKNRDISAANGSVGLVWMERTQGEPRMFIYRHNQQLSYLSCSVDGIPTTYIASRQYHFPEYVLARGFGQPKLIEEGAAFEVTPEGLNLAWRNPKKAKVFVRETVVNGQYVGG